MGASASACACNRATLSTSSSNSSSLQPSPPSKLPPPRIAGWRAGTRAGRAAGGPIPRVTHPRHRRSSASSASPLSAPSTMPLHKPATRSPVCEPTRAVVHENVGALVRENVAGLATWAYGQRARGYIQHSEHEATNSTEAARRSGAPPASCLLPPTYHLLPHRKTRGGRQARQVCGASVAAAPVDPTHLRL